MLTREEILNIVDIQTKEIHVPIWDTDIYIRQLSRGEQDTYLKRQYGNTRLKQDRKAKEQEISAVSIYGHDAYICVCGICDESGERIFKMSDLQGLDNKNGEAVGFIAKEVIEFSGMGPDVEELDELKN